MTRFAGLFIQDVPSGGRTLAGVSTSITAFVGWADQGPTNQAQQVLSVRDFESRFGGLDRRSWLGYCVQHFFTNGGREAYIVRLTADDAVTASVVIDAKLVVSAASPGAWANLYSIATKQSSLDATRFTLAMFHQPAGQTAVMVESFENLSMEQADSRFIGNIVNRESALGQLRHPIQHCGQRRHAAQPKRGGLREQT